MRGVGRRTKPPPAPRNGARAGRAQLYSAVPGFERFFGKIGGLNADPFFYTRTREISSASHSAATAGGSAESVTMRDTSDMAA